MQETFKTFYSDIFLEQTNVLALFYMINWKHKIFLSVAHLDVKVGNLRDNNEHFQLLTKKR